MGFHAQPRATIDLDINVFVTEKELASVLDTLEKCKCSFDRQEATRSVAERGDFRVWKERHRIDFFISFHPYHDDVEARIEWAELRGTKVPILSAEDIIIFKTLFSRPKDWVDVTNLVAAHLGRLDQNYIKRWIEELLPEEDERRTRLKELLMNFSSS